jgi:hypothetical protein
VFVGVAENQPGVGEYDDGDVSPDLVAVDGRLVVHQERHHVLAGHCRPDPCGDDLRVVAGLLDRDDEVVEPVVRSNGTHGLSLSRIRAGQARTA